MSEYYSQKEAVEEFLWKNGTSSRTEIFEHIQVNKSSKAGIRLLRAMVEERRIIKVLTHKPGATHGIMYRINEQNYARNLIKCQETQKKL